MKPSAKFNSQTKKAQGLTTGGSLSREPHADLADDEKNFAVIDASTGVIETRPTKINLSSLDDVRLEMSKVYRSMKSGEVECQNGTRLVYVLGQIAKLHEITEVAARLAALERAVVPRRSR
jgi:hypothetical protein